MTLQLIGGASIPIGLPAFPRISINDSPSLGSSTMDAAGEMVAMIGRVWFAAGPGTSKTVSSAGGIIQWRTGTVGAWAGTTTIRVGIQDVSTTTGPPARPVEDWTTGSPPYKDLIRGTDALASNTWYSTLTAISTGSRTLTHGDLIAVVWDMTTHSGGGGNTDSVNVACLGGGTGATTHMPQVTAKVGTPAWAATTLIPNVVITCDDGTLAFLEGSLPVTSVTSRAFNIDTGTADEYGNIFVPSGALGVDELWAVVDPDESYDLILYSDALNVTAPTSEQSVSCDLNITSAASNGHMRAAIGQETLTAGTAYAVTVRPTSTTNLTMIEVAVNAAGHLAVWPGGTGMYKCTRLGAANALTTTTTARMLCGVSINKWDDGTGTVTSRFPVSGTIIA